jgi:hypothetical protein
LDRGQTGSGLGGTGTGTALSEARGLSQDALVHDDHQGFTRRDDAYEPSSHGQYRLFGEQ